MGQRDRNTRTYRTEYPYNRRLSDEKIRCLCGGSMTERARIGINSAAFYKCTSCGARDTIIKGKRQWFNEDQPRYKTNGKNNKKNSKKHTKRSE